MNYIVLAYLPTHIGGKLTNIPIGPLCNTTSTEQVIAVIQKAQTDATQSNVKLLVFKSEVGKSYSTSDLTLSSPLLVCITRYIGDKWHVFYNDKSFRTHARKLAGLGVEITGKFGRNMFFVD